MGHFKCHNTGNLLATHQTNNDSDVILGDRCTFTDHLRMFSNIMMAPDATPLNVSNMLNQYQIRTSSWLRWCNDILII